MSHQSGQDTDEDTLVGKPQIKKQEDVWDQGHKKAGRSKVK